MNSFLAAMYGTKPTESEKIAESENPLAGLSDEELLKFAEEVSALETDEIDLGKVPASLFVEALMDAEMEKEAEGRPGLLRRFGTRYMSALKGERFRAARHAQKEGIPLYEVVTAKEKVEPKMPAGQRLPQSFWPEKEVYKGLKPREATEEEKAEIKKLIRGQLIRGAAETAGAWAAPAAAAAGAGTLGYKAMKRREKKSARS
jgi:hypothetical protein